MYVKIKHVIADVTRLYLYRSYSCLTITALTMAKSLSQVVKEGAGSLTRRNAQNPVNINDLYPSYKTYEPLKTDSIDSIEFGQRISEPSDNDDVMVIDPTDEEKGGVIIDCEGFILTHHDIIYRQISYAAVKSDVTHCFDIFTPKVFYHKLTDSQRRTVRYCTFHVHGLRMAYEPNSEGAWLSRSQLKQLLLDLHERFGTILYKGGVMEKHLCDQYGIPCRDIGDLVPKASVTGQSCDQHVQFKPHCSLCDVINYKKSFLKLSE